MSTTPVSPLVITAGSSIVTTAGTTIEESTL